MFDKFNAFGKAGKVEKRTAIRSGTSYDDKSRVLLAFFLPWVAMWIHDLAVQLIW